MVCTSHISFCSNSIIISCSNCGSRKCLRIRQKNQTPKNIDGI
ncbi:hypothetical protein C5167_043789 [Papaver somniferum]|uniref:Uncharacterized protein n=1 Tax=Papaver somniferum TaxID=3469 RepID=A0A4Y7LAK5_PAPSO|nr:hypothetical protein C5167_043789 [Papaver somniferum]